jgi:tRNA (cmo5U34)-methyltransferase
MSYVGDNINADCGNWSFKGDTVKDFDKHVKKSVPLYEEGHNLICDISDFFVNESSIVYEIGCSTGALSIKLAQHNINKMKARFVGIDIENDMVDAANKNKKKYPDINVDFMAADALEVELEPSDLIVCYYTVQFIHPSVRQELINKLYKSLNWGGALLLFEKVRGPDARFQDIMTSLYTDYKIRVGYTPGDIVAKSRSLKGILEPFSTQGNIDMLRRAGFVDINTIQKYICFEGFIAIK